jgi:hypothetical protein
MLEIFTILGFSENSENFLQANISWATVIPTIYKAKRMGEKVTLSRLLPAKGYILLSLLCPYGRPHVHTNYNIIYT